MTDLIEVITQLAQGVNPGRMLALQVGDETWFLVRESSRVVEALPTRCHFRAAVCEVDYVRLVIVALRVGSRYYVAALNVYEPAQFAHVQRLAEQPKLRTAFSNGQSLDETRGFEVPNAIAPLFSLILNEKPQWPPWTSEDFAGAWAIFQEQYRTQRAAWEAIGQAVPDTSQVH